MRTSTVIFIATFLLIALFLTILDSHGGDFSAAIADLWSQILLLFKFLLVLVVFFGGIIYLEYKGIKNDPTKIEELAKARVRDMHEAYEDKDQWNCM